MINTEDKENDEFEYDLDEAAEIVWENVSLVLKNKYEFEDIQAILEIEFDYLESAGIILKEGEELPVNDYPVEIDWDEMQYYIITNAVKKNIILNYDELDEILDAESIYYDRNGALGDAGEYLN